MKWSVSASKAFFQCPKKWYYETVFASSRSSDTKRKEAYFLKHLQSIHSWRGKLVDQVITMFIVPRLNKRRQVEKSEVLSYADRLMEAQLEFARSKMYRSLDSKKNAYNYCALLELENNSSLDEESIEQVKSEVKSSLLNLLDSVLLSELAEKGLYLIAQRTLQFRFTSMTIKCTPDLIAFFKERPPFIVDWKVETARHREHWLQLGIYGFALSRVKPHKDFPNDWRDILTDPTKIELMEFQLLRNQEIKYVLTEKDISDIEDYIYTSSLRMKQMINSGKPPELLIKILPKARSPWTCQWCKFRGICWEEQFS